MFVYTVISLVPPPLPLRKKALVLDPLIKFTHQCMDSVARFKEDTSLKSYCKYHVVSDKASLALGL